MSRRDLDDGCEQAFGGAQVGKLTIQSQAEDLAPAQPADKKPVKPRTGSAQQKQKAKPSVCLDNILLRACPIQVPKLLGLAAYRYCAPCPLQCQEILPNKAQAQAQSSSIGFIM